MYVTCADCSGTCCGLKAHQPLYCQLLLIILHNYMYTYVRMYTYNATWCHAGGGDPYWGWRQGQRRKCKLLQMCWRLVRACAYSTWVSVARIMWAQKRCSVDSQLTEVLCIISQFIYIGVPWFENTTDVCFFIFQDQECVEIPVDPQQLDSEIKAIMMVCAYVCSANGWLVDALHTYKCCLLIGLLPCIVTLSHLRTSTPSRDIIFTSPSSPSLCHFVASDSTVARPPGTALYCGATGQHSAVYDCSSHGCGNAAGQQVYKPMGGVTLAVCALQQWIYCTYTHVAQWHRCCGTVS